MINITTKNVIDVQDWDSLVQDTYGKPYNFQQQDGCQGRGLVTIAIPDYPYDYENSSVPEVINGEEMGVSFKAWLARSPDEWNGDPEDKRFLDLFWGRNFYPDIQTLANDLFEKCLIAEGDYSINIDW